MSETPPEGPPLAGLMLITPSAIVPNEELDPYQTLLSINGCFARASFADQEPPENAPGSVLLF